MTGDRGSPSGELAVTDQPLIGTTGEETQTMHKTVSSIATAAIVAVVAIGCVPEESAERQQRQDTTQAQAGKPPKDDKPEGRLETGAEANARATAESYLDSAAFSREGLIDQLKYEGFGEKVATYGVDAAGADWREQAVLSAESYLDGQAFSRAGLIDQLKYEGFTQAQAVHGVSVAYR